MGKRWLAAAVAAASMGVGAPSALATVEVGDDCRGDFALATTVVPIARESPSALPLTVPNAGIVTSWKVRSAVSDLRIEKLKVFRSGAAPGQFTTVAETPPVLIQKGTNVFETRIPVQAGDRFGAFGDEMVASGGVIVCGSQKPGDVYGFLIAETTVGSTDDFVTAIKVRVAVSAVVEPDVDGDGFGDETQDKCPRSARLQTECPPTSLTSFGFAAKGSALLLVAASSPAPVTVEATVRVPGKEKKGRDRARTLTLSGGTQAVPPGLLAQFAIPYPASLKTALGRLSPKRSLALEVTSSTADAAGQASATTTTLRIKGQAKAKKKRNRGLGADRVP